MALTVSDYSREVIYPKPNPGGNQFNEFVGASLKPDGQVAVGFIEAFPTAGQTGRDWSKTQPQQHILQSPGFTKDGEIVRPLGPVKPLPAYTMQPMLWLPNGEVVGRANYEDTGQPPQTAVLERRLTDGSWVTEGTFGVDATRQTAQVSRMKENAVVGGIRATGQRWPAPGGQRVGVAGTDPLLQISRDFGKSWDPGLFFAPGQAAMTFFNEWDTAEMPDGSLAVMVRCGVGWNRKQPTDAASKKTQLSSVYAFALWPARPDGSGWNYVEPAKVSFSTTTNPIHPDLFVCNQTGALVFASTGPEGWRYSYDAGRTWAGLPGVAATNYYPRCVQEPNGTVHAFSHVGGDDDINERDQQIVHQSFRLADPTRPKPVFVTLPAKGFEVSNIVEVPLEGANASWSNLKGAAASDSSYAYVDLTGSGHYSNLIAEIGPENLPDIPDDHQIDTLTFRARVRRGATGSNQSIRTHGGVLLLGGKTASAMKGVTEANWPTVAEHDELFTFSRAAGDMDLTGADLKSEEFGWAAAFKGMGTGVRAELNSFALIDVTHSAPVVVDPPPDELAEALARIADLETQLAAAEQKLEDQQILYDAAEDDLAKLEDAINEAISILKPAT
jgi:hypothetical protein